MLWRISLMLCRLGWHRWQYRWDIPGQRPQRACHRCGAFHVLRAGVWGPIVIVVPRG